MMQPQLDTGKASQYTVLFQNIFVFGVYLVMNGDSTVEAVVGDDTSCAGRVGDPGPHPPVIPDSITSWPRQQQENSILFIESLTTRVLPHGEERSIPSMSLLRDRSSI